MTYAISEPKPISYTAIREVFVPAGTDAVGYHVSGAQRGPTLLIASDAEVIQPVYRRVLALPNLPWLRGNLLLVRLGQTAGPCDAIMLDQLAAQFNPIDDVLHIAGSGSDQQALYWTILRFCAKYGMISGRGVPMRAPASQMLGKASSFPVSEHSVL